MIPRLTRRRLASERSRLVGVEFAQRAAVLICQHVSPSESPLLSRTMALSTMRSLSVQAASGTFLCFPLASRRLQNVRMSRLKPTTVSMAMPRVVRTTALPLFCTHESTASLGPAMALQILLPKAQCPIQN